MKYLLTVGPDQIHVDTFIFPAEDWQVRLLITTSAFIGTKAVIQPLNVVMKNLNLPTEDAVIDHYEQYGSCEIVDNPEDIVDAITADEDESEIIVAALREPLVTQS